MLFAMGGENIVCFDSQVLQCLRFENNDMAESMLNEDLCRLTDHWGTLLHYAADYGSAWVTKYLIKLGSDVDCLNQDGKTPLIIALEKDRHWIVHVLLEANANVYITGPDGKSPFQLLFYLKNLSGWVLEPFLSKIRSEVCNTEQFIEVLIDAGCSAYHAVFSKDLEVIEGLLKRGIDVNSKGYHNKTALHAAAYENDFHMVKMLIDKGADVCALDDYGGNALISAALHGNQMMLQLLLEKGADVNVRISRTGHTALYEVYGFSGEKSKEMYDKCAELLFFRGAIPQNATFEPCSILEKTYVKCYRDSYRTKLLIAHLAMLDMLDTSIIQTLINGTIIEYRIKYPEFGKYHDLCQQTLKISVFESLTLLDLLNESEDKMRIHVRNVSFVDKMTQLRSDQNFSEQFPLYFKNLEGRISKAIRTKELEDTAILIICNIIEKNCYIVARKIVGYLNEHALEQLCRVYGAEYS